MKYSNVHRETTQQQSGLNTSIYEGHRAYDRAPRTRRTVSAILHTSTDETAALLRHNRPWCLGYAAAGGPTSGHSSEKHPTRYTREQSFG